MGVEIIGHYRYSFIVLLWWLQLFGFEILVLVYQEGRG